MVTNHESGRASRVSGSLHNSALFFFLNALCTVRSWKKRKRCGLAFNRARAIGSPEKRCCTGLGKRQGRENKASQTDEYTGQTRD